MCPSRSLRRMAGASPSGRLRTFGPWRPSRRQPDRQQAANCCRSPAPTEGQRQARQRTLAFSMAGVGVFSEPREPRVDHPSDRMARSLASPRRYAIPQTEARVPSQLSLCFMHRGQRRWLGGEAAPLGSFRRFPSGDLPPLPWSKDRVWPHWLMA